MKHLRKLAIFITCVTLLITHITSYDYNIPTPLEHHEETKPKA